MTDNANNTGKWLGQARDLVTQLEAGNETEVHRLVDELTSLRESHLFQEVGKLTRELHEAMNSFRLDSRLSDITATDIPDAKDRLNYVITMTEQAAHRTLDVVEQTLPLTESLSRQAAELKAPIATLRDAKTLNGLGDRLDSFIDEVARDSAIMQQNLSEVLIAQDYQDITGQIIRRVINLVHEVETSLVGMVRISGQRMAPAKPSVPEHLDGPRIQGKEGADQVTGQDDVDDLLSSLGF
jgi:chemotaxis protein CheZ